jgi:2-polyprenyl-6-methoxyphenol hydroxylase-like FAD-dependent oxidoreductase
MKIVINGCGVAGPALAWWLLRHGHEPVLVEQAPQPREGGYVIDFWGLGYDICEKMDLIPRIREAGYQVGEVRFVDAKGRRRSGFDTDVLRRMTRGRFTSLRRSDLGAALHGAVEGRAEAMFGESIASIEEHAGGVRVGFEHAAPRDFDLVIGADGLHSRVRALTFGPEADHERFLGYHVAAFDVAGYRPRDEDVYVSFTEPGRQVSRFSMRGDRTLFLFVFRDQAFGGDLPRDEAGRRAALRAVFGRSGWECPRILDAMDGVETIYFDRVSQIRMPAWSKGRTALIGDAAAAVSLLAGEGTGLAIAEAYVLAGELHRAGGDHAAAFAAYERRLMPFLAGKQESARKFASTFAPKSRTALLLRDLAMWLMRFPKLAEFFVGDLEDDIELPDYGAD